MSDVYIVGVDMIKFGRFPEKSVPEIGAEAALLALDPPPGPITTQLAMARALGPYLEGRHDEADRLAGEKTWLTVLSVLFAIALFWLGLAEITAGRWRWVNLAIGVAIFVLSLGFFGAIELFYLDRKSVV